MGCLFSSGLYLRFKTYGSLINSETINTTSSSEKPQKLGLNGASCDFLYSFSSFTGFSLLPLRLLSVCFSLGNKLPILDLQYLLPPQRTHILPLTQFLMCRTSHRPCSSSPSFWAKENRQQWKVLWIATVDRYRSELLHAMEQPAMFAISKNSFHNPVLLLNLSCLKFYLFFVVQIKCQLICDVLLVSAWEDGLCILFIPLL